MKLKVKGRVFTAKDLEAFNPITGESGKRKGEAGNRRSAGQSLTHWIMPALEYCSLPQLQTDCLKALASNSGTAGTIVLPLTFFPARR